MKCAGLVVLCGWGLASNFRGISIYNPTAGTRANGWRWHHMAKCWTEEETNKLKRLRQLGASAARAAVALKWSKTAVKAKARELGIPFPSWRTQRSEQRAKEATARARAGLPEKPL
jgi:hypothetical protein